MTSKSTFKGFTFTKKSNGQFVPPPKAAEGKCNQISPLHLPKASSATRQPLSASTEQTSVLHSARSARQTAADSAGACRSGSFQNNVAVGAFHQKTRSSGGSSESGITSSQVQTSLQSFFNPSPLRPVATVMPQGHDSSSSSSHTRNAGLSSVSPIVGPETEGLQKRKRKDDSVIQSQLSITDLCDFDDDDDFDLPTHTQVIPKHNTVLVNIGTSSDEENTGSSDDEILPARKRRSMVIKSDDENTGDGEQDSSIMAPTPPKPTGLSLSIAKRFPLSAMKSVGKSEVSCARLVLSVNSHSDTPVSISRSASSSQKSATSLHLNQKKIDPERMAASSLNRLQEEPNLAESLHTNSTFRDFSQPERSSLGSLESLDFTKHPLLMVDHSKMTQEQRTEMQSLLLQVTDEVCEIICSASTAALMNLGLQDYGRLPMLLAVRKQIKDKGVAVSSTVSNCKSLSAAASKPSTSTNNLNNGLSTPMCSPPVSSSTAVKKVPVTKCQPVGDSPVPCGDSFFEDVTAYTQSHMTYMRGFKTPGANTSPVSMVSRPSLVAPLSRIESDFLTLAKCENSAPNERNVLETSSLILGSEDSFDIDAGFKTSIPQTYPKSTVVVLSQERFDTVCNNSVMPTSQNSPIVVLSQDSSSNHIHEAGDGSFEEKIVSQTVKRQHQMTKSGQCENVLRDKKYKRALSDEQFDDFMDDFDDDDFDYEESLEMAEDGQKPFGTTSVEDTAALDPYVPIFGSTDKDDGATGEFEGEGFPHSQELRNMFHSVFGLREFRHNQLQAINAALLGNDCFVLMPTGGGKSLCYQLPALVTPGITIVVSPLRALIQDQVQRLISFDIPAAHLSGELDNTQANTVYSSLYQRQPSIKLLYVTPEKVCASDKLMNCLDSLYQRNMLDRFIIDEAHCVSQWGHDFRPDYKRLNIMRSRFPNVPIMALTATATPRVRRDIIHQLSMSQPKWFMQSFNRPNLKYSVRPKKPSNAIKDVIELIKSKFKNECGIVYCLSRKECDTLADSLLAAGIEASSYHAGLGDSERTQVQDRWLTGDRCKVICATIAFGMGIDKAEVRFVIHFSLPKSVEGYYQEAGRAGRDGMLAHCLLLYTYSDVKRLRRIIDMDKSTTYESRRVHIDNLFRMVQYCENLADCRRGQVLQYFGEHHFDRERCNIVSGAICDNCSSKDMFVVRDVTDDGKAVVKCVRELTSNPRNNFTVLHFVEIFKGSQNTRIMDLGHNRLALHGHGAAYSRGDAERLMHRLVVDGVLTEELKITAADTAACYVRLGPKAADLINGKMKIDLAVQGGRKRAEANRIGQEPQTNRQQLVEGCYKELVAMAKTIATEHGSKNYALIFPNTMLWQLAEKNPITVEEMKREIDGLPEAKINKYGAHRFLEVTSRYKLQLTALQDEVADNNENALKSTDDWASPYFDASLANSGARGKTFGRSRGGKTRGKKSRGGWKKHSVSGSSSKSNVGNNQRGKGQASKSRGTRGRGGNKSWSGNLAGFGGGEKQNKGVGKSSLGLMPDPRARSYLASVGSYMG